MTGQLRKVKLSFWQIWNMNVGFFGIQYSFGLQQSAVNPIYEQKHRYYTLLSAFLSTFIRRL